MEIFLIQLMCIVFFVMRIFLLGGTPREVRKFRLISGRGGFCWAHVILQCVGRIARESAEIVRFDGNFLAWELVEVSVF